MPQIDWNTLLTAFVILFCVIPLALTLVIGFILFRASKRWLEPFLRPEPHQLQAELLRLRRKYPQETTAQLVNRLIGRQAVRGGVLGALTSIGGFVTLPIALPIDILGSLRIQGYLVNIIAQAYGHTETSELEQQVRTYLITTGSSEITQGSIRVMMRFVARVAGETLAKFVPFIGAMVGFIVNYLMIQATGRVAAGWYSKRPVIAPHV